MIPRAGNALRMPGHAAALLPLIDVSPVSVHLVAPTPTFAAWLRNHIGRLDAP